MTRYKLYLYTIISQESVKIANVTFDITINYLATGFDSQELCKPEIPLVILYPYLGLVIVSCTNLGGTYINPMQLS